MSELITLDQNTPSVQYLCKKDKRLAKVISMVGPITYKPHYQEPYSFVIHEIIEQMLSIKAGNKIYERLKDLCHGEITPKNVIMLTENQIRSTGTSSAKAKYILGITESVISGELDFDDLTDLNDDEITKKLTSYRGIGNWTAKMYLIFVLNRQDIFPYEDGTFVQAYRWLFKTDDVNPASIKKRCRKWKPYSSIAARYLYEALDAGLTKEEFHLFK